MSLESGQVVRWHFSFGGQLSCVCPMRVVEHTAEGLFVWLAGNSPVWQVAVPGGRHLRDIPPGARPAGGYPLVPDRWYENGSLIYQPDGADHAVWWRFAPGSGFAGWYVNMERRSRQGADIHVVDHELDLVVGPDRGWAWKDEESFREKTGDPAYWTVEQAAAIRAEGERVLRSAEARAFPFDGSWCDFRPPADWGTPQLPEPPRAALPGQSRSGPPQEAAPRVDFRAN